jgi:hypothetical protein
MLLPPCLACCVRPPKPRQREHGSDGGARCALGGGGAEKEWKDRDGEEG